MTEWHLWEIGSTQPIIFNDATLLQNALSTYPVNTQVIVKTYKSIEVGTVFYNLAGGETLPTKPLNVPHSTNVSITHVIKSS